MQGFSSIPYIVGVFETFIISPVCHCMEIRFYHSFHCTKPSYGWILAQINNVMQVHSKTVSFDIEIGSRSMEPNS